MGEGRGRTRQMGRGRRDQPGIAGNTPNFRTCRLLHGLDKRRQPAAVHATCPAGLNSRCLKLVSHGPRIFPERIQPGIRRVVPANLTQRKCARCDLLHRGPSRSVVEVRNDPRNAPDDVGPAARPRDRLRPDRNRRGGRLDRTGFPHSGLRNRGQQRLRFRLGAATRQKVQAASNFYQRHHRSAELRPVSSKTPSSGMHPAVADSHIALCESCIRHIRPFASCRAGA